MAGAMKIGAGLSVDGEQAFRSAISNINKDMAVLASEAKKVTAQFADNKDSVEALTAQNEIYNKKAEEQKKKIDTITTALDKAKKEYGENSSQVKKWQIELNNAEAQLAYTEKAVRDNTKQIDELGKETKEAGDKAEKSNEGWGKLTAALGVAAKAAAAMAAAAVAAGTALIAMSVSGAKYADEVLTIATQTGLATDEIQKFKYSSELLDVSLETLTGSMARQIKSMAAVKDGTSEAVVDTEKLAAAQSKSADAATALEQAQIKLDSATISVSTAESKAASALLDVEKAQKKYNDTVWQYGSYSAQAAAAALELEKTQNKAGEAANNVLIAQNNAAATALALEKAQTALTESYAAISAASVAVAPELDEMTKAYDRLGVKVRDSVTGELRDSEMVYWEIIDALGKMENETERDALAMQILGKSAQDLNPLIAAGADKIKALGDEAAKSGYVLSGDTLNAYGAFDDSLQRLKNGAESAKNAIGTILLPALTSLAGEGTGLLTAFTNGIAAADGDMSKISEVVSSTIQSFVGLVAGALPDIIDLGMSILGALGQGLLDNIGTIADAAVNIVLQLVNGLFTALPQIMDAAITIITTLLDALVEFYPRIYPVMAETIVTMVKGLIKNLPKILDAALEVVMALTAGILDALPVLIAALPQLILGIVNFVISSIPQIIQAGIDLLTSLIDALPEIITQICVAIPEIILGINAALIENLPKIIEAGVMLFVALVAATPRIIKGIVAALPEIVMGIADAFKGYTSHMSDVGLRWIQGIWEGIKNAAEWIKGKIKEFSASIVDGIKEFFGINSPSKLFEEQIGKNLALGLGVGFTKKMKDISKDMHNAVPTNFSANLSTNIVSSGVNGSSYSSAPAQSAAAGGVFDVTIPFSMGGQQISKIISRIQYDATTRRARVLGVGV